MGWIDACGRSECYGVVGSWQMLTLVVVKVGVDFFEDGRAKVCI